MSPHVRLNVAIAAGLGLMCTISTSVSHRVQAKTVASLWNTLREYPWILAIACLLPWLFVPGVWLVRKLQDQMNPSSAPPQGVKIVVGAVWSAILGIFIGLTTGNLLSALMIQQPWMWYGLAINASCLAATFVAWCITMRACRPSLTANSQS